MLFFYVKNLIYILIIIIDKIINRYLLNKKICWSISYSRVNWDKIGSKKIYQINNPKNKWFADPQVVKKNKNYFIFFEDYSTVKKRGSISCVKIDKNNNQKYYENILTRTYHLSFPFIFKYKNNFYLIPESSEINSINIYKCLKFPNKWKFYKTILKSRSVDHIIFEHKKYWYLLNNEKSVKHIYSKLVGYKNINPLSNKWKKIRLTKNSFLLGRNAGYFKSKNRKYRVSQSYLPGRYGAGVFVNRINDISTTTFNESIEKMYFPNLFSKKKGIHTLNSVKNFTVFDTSKWKN